MNDLNTDPNLWTENLDSNKVQIWREALAHLRHLSDEAWKGLRFFMSINGFIIVAMLIIVVANIETRWALIIMSTLGLLGLGNSLVGRYVLKRNRIYYLEMLLKKTLLEDELGFYAIKFSESNSDLAFPWRLKPEAIPDLKQKPDEWLKQQIRGPGTIARWLFVMFEAVIIVYLLILIGLIIAWFQ